MAETSTRKAASRVNPTKRHILVLLILLVAVLLLPSCAKVALEGGDKPIHIVMDINIRVDQELERFFAFEDQYRNAPTTRPAATTQPVANNGERSMP
jgi:hypothetical protein